MALTSKNSYRFNWRHKKYPDLFSQLKYLVFAKLDIVKVEAHETGDSSRLVDSVMVDSSIEYHMLMLSFLNDWCNKLRQVRFYHFAWSNIPQTKNQGHKIQVQGYYWILSQSFFKFLLIKWVLWIWAPKFCCVIRSTSAFLKQSSNEYRSSYRKCSMKKGLPRNFAKFAGKQLCQSLFFNKVAGWLKKHFD